MSNPLLRALVVDDDVSIRRLTARALRGEGFACDLANDGAEAQLKLDADRYDLVVTDLCMPNRHGHALASDLAQQTDRPLVVVLTALSDPRMTKDLLMRGVDDVTLKPVDYLAFAAKLRALVKRRTIAPCATDTAIVASRAAGNARVSPKAPVMTPMSLREFETHLAKVEHVLPLSQHTLAVSQLAQSKVCSLPELATAVENEAALAAEILRLANSSYYNPAGNRIMDLVEAIPRVGHRRVGELALSMHALRLLQIGKLPWMDRELAWHRSVAAGLAADLLVAQGEHAAIQNGLFLSACMHSLGRVTLGLLFPQHYEAFVEECRECNQTLQELESRVFPASHAASMARLLQTWSVPPDVYQPLRYLLDDFNATARFAEPMRSKIELVKLAALLGWIAVGRWEPWDTVECISHKVLKRLRIVDPASVLDQIRNGMGSFTGSATAACAPSDAAPEPAVTTAKREIWYRAISIEPYDLYIELFKGMNLTVAGPPESMGPAGKAEIVNCLAASPAQVTAFCKSEACRETILLGSGRQLDQYASKGQIVRIPTSYVALRTACEQAIV